MPTIVAPPATSTPASLSMICSTIWKPGSVRSVPRAEAIRYALSRWDGLSVFLDDGRVELDTNTVERSIRPLALNRKNALFAGSDEGGDNWAVIATLIENCKIAGINPHTWLTETLTKLADGHPANSVRDLMPWIDVG
jgi:transposase